MIRANFSPQEMLDWARGFVGNVRDPGLASFFLPRLAAGLGFDEAALSRDAAGGKRGATAAATARKTGARRGPAEGTAQHDKEILDFVIRNTDYIPRLAQEGVHEEFTTGRAVAFWEILSRVPEGDLTQLLDEKQKQFYVPRSFLGPWPEETAEDFFVDLLRRVSRTRRKKRKEALLEHLRRADPGDIELKKSILAEIDAIDSLRRRADEQS
jgi:DNA primase